MDLVTFLERQLRVRRLYPSRGENPKGGLGQNWEPFHVKTPNGARGKKLKGASLGENLERRCPNGLSHPHHETTKG